MPPRRRGASSTGARPRSSTGGHPRLAAALATARRVGGGVSPLRLFGYATHEVHRNPLLVPAYLAIALPADGARMALASTMPAAHAATFFLGSVIPSTLGALFGAHHAVKVMKSTPGTRPTLRSSLTDLASGYVRYKDRLDRKIDRVAARLAAQ